MKKIILIVLITQLLSYSQIINKNLFFDGLDREYIIYVPSNYNGSQSVPLLFSFHGGGGYASDHMLMTNFNVISDTAGFIAVYPQGAVDYNGADPGTTPSTSWLHKAPTDHNDINFIAAIIDTLANEFMIDQNRVYACGYSEGGIFSYELGCRLSDRVAAFSSVSGSMLTDAFRSNDYGFGICSPSHPTAVMLIPGDSDFNYHSMYDGFQPYYMAVSEITEYWQNFNNTDVSPIVNNIINSNTTDGSTVEKREWLNGENCVSVTELKVIGGGHDWPGSSGNMDISASEEIWRFVSQYDINGLIGCSTNYNNQFNNSDYNRQIIKIVDMLGRESIKSKFNTLFYIYNDGSVEKKITIN